MRLGLGIGLGSGLFRKNIPFKSDALFWLDGVITIDGSDYYFRDKSGNGRDFLITGYDFDSSWSKGFPYKSAATISAPAADATLIAEDINNYLYDSGGTPNAIPVVSLFQDVDYEHKLFCKHKAQAVDGNGVETYEPRVVDIVLYDTVKADADLIKCQDYFGVPVEVTSNVKWVSKAGNDSTGNGTKANPWLTFVKANASATIGDTVYIKSGAYAENSPYLAGCFYINKSLNYYGLGRTYLQSTGANYVVFYASGDCIIKNIVIDAQAGKNICFNVYNIGAKAISFESCSFIGANGVIYNGQAVENSTFKHCVFKGLATNATNAIAFYPSIIDTCYFIDSANTVNRDLVLKNTKVPHNDKDYCFRVNNNAINAYGNILNYSGSGIIENADFSSAKNVTIKYNTFNQGDKAITLVRALEFRGTCIVVIENNVFNSTQTNYSATTQMFVYLVDTVTPEINYNKFISTSVKTFDHIGILLGGTVAIGSAKIKGNYSKSASLAGVQIALGYEGTSVGKTNGSVLMHNRIIGFKKDNPLGVAAGKHDVLLNCGINFDVRYNHISHSDLGLVIKAGDTTPYTENGVQYNLIEECRIAIYARGVYGLTINNNTIYHSDTVYNAVFGVGIYADENTGKVGDQFCEDIVCKNNIIVAPSSSGSLVQFDDHAAANGCDFINGILFGGAYKLRSDSEIYETILESQGDGFLSNCLDSDPLLTNLIPQIGSPAIGLGVDLGADYDDGLDVSTNWGSDTELPVIVTKQQGASWDIGAYVS